MSAGAGYGRRVKPPIPVLALGFSLLAWHPLGAQVIHSEKENFKVEVVADGLDHPWGLVELPDGRLLVTERAGAMRVIEGGHLVPAPVSGMPPVFARGQGGLLDVQLHPDYATNGWIYIAFSDERDGKGMTKIIRGKLRDMAFVDQETIFAAPAEEYTSARQHFGCRMDFDGKGHLFFSVGERGDMKNAQMLGNAKGKVHRIHDDGRIPADNPFVKEPGTSPTIWTYGNRNPQGLRFDKTTGLLWESEHGPRGGDELNIIEKGKNYGWPTITYGINYDGTPITDKTSAPGMEQPVTYWVPSIAVSAIEFYHGDRFPKWKGDLFAGALAHQKLVRMELGENNTVTHQEILLEKSGRIRDIQCLRDGAITIVYDDPGKIVRLVPAD